MCDRMEVVSMERMCCFRAERIVKCMGDGKAARGVDGVVAWRVMV